MMGRSGLELEIFLEIGR
jgi:hypothetical protein